MPVQIITCCQFSHGVRCTWHEFKLASDAPDSNWDITQYHSIRITALVLDRKYESGKFIRFAMPKRTCWQKSKEIGALHCTVCIVLTMISIPRIELLIILQPFLNQISSFKFDIYEYLASIPYHHLLQKKVFLITVSLEEKKWKDMKWTYVNYIRLYLIKRDIYRARMIHVHHSYLVISPCQPYRGLST